MANGGRQFIEQVVTDQVTDRVSGVARVVGSGPPVAGAHIVGDFVENVAPAAYGSLGWVCVGAGTPGIWQALSTVGAVDTIANRDAIPAAQLVTGEVVRVISTGAWYQWGGAAWTWLDTGRPQSNRGAWIGGTTLYVDSVAGSDDTGTGLVGAPYRTLLRCFADIGFNNPTTVTVQVVAGSALSLPGNMVDLAYITIQGTTTATGVGTVATITLASEAAGMALNVTGLAGGADAHKGQLIQWTNGPMNGRYGWIYRNDALDTYVPGETRIYVSYSGTTFLAPLAGNTFNLLALDSALIVDGAGSSGTTLNGNSVTAFTLLRIEEPGGTYTRRFASTTMARASFNQCSIKIKEFGGNAILTCCYGNNRSASGQTWIMYIGSNFNAQQGTVFDGTGVVNGARYIISQSSTVTFCPGQVVFTGQWNGLQFDDSDVNLGRASGTFSAVDGLFFDPGSLCTGNAIQINPNRFFGSGYFFPNLYGQIAGNYAIQATGGARVKISPASALVTALGAGFNNAVRGDGTNTTCCGPDGTSIQGGYPNGWVLVNAGSGISPAFQNNWVAVATFQAPAFRLTPDGFCHLDGNIGGGSDNTVAFTLPAGYRPTVQHVFAAWDSVAQTDVAWVTVAAAGTVTINCPGATTNVSLSGIHFPVAASL